MMGEKPKLLYYDDLNFRQENLDLLDEHFEVVKLNNPGEDDQKVLDLIDVTFAPLGFYCGAEKMDRCPNLKVVASNTTGTPHIDCEAAKARGIKVVSLKEESEFLSTITPTAEHTWGLMLSLLRHVVPASKSVCEGKWSRWPYGSPQMLSRMSLGVVGLGRIGTWVARYGKAFGMEVSFYDPYVDVGPDPTVKKMKQLEELVARHDIISLHVHLNEETTQLIDAKMLSQFKEGSWLINTSRGAVVDSTALLESLKSGHLRGAALDVLDDEFEQDFDKSTLEHPLVQYANEYDNLLITPHIAGSTIDAWTLTQKHTIHRVMEELGLG